MGLSVSITAPLPRLAGRVGSSRADQGGFSLIETLVATSMFLVIMLATLSLFDTSQKTASSDLARSAAVRDASASLQAMDHELRGAYEVVGPLITAKASLSTATSNYLDVYVRNNTGHYRVLYDCTIASPTLAGARACTRYIGLTGAADTVPGGTKGAAIVDHLLNGTSGEPVFTLTYPAGATRPDYASVVIKVPAKSERAVGDPSTIELTDGVYMSALNLAQ
jgi:type II secretory pathway pseudopilin PulG